MGDVSLIPLLSRWIHVIGAITFVGGTIYMHLALRPELVEDTTGLRERMMKRWKHIVALTFVFIFGSGFYNYLAVTRHVHPDQPQYHMLFGIKFLLAIVAFVMVFVVTSTMDWSEKLRDKGFMWLLALAASLGVVLVAGYMKLMPPG